MYYDNIIRALNKNKVKFAVAGGVAVVVYGYTRFTADLDLVVELEKENLALFFDTLYGLKYRPKVPVTKKQFIDERCRREWIRKKGMVVFSFYHLERPLELIDVFVTEPIKFSEIEREMEKVRIKDLAIPVLSIRHLKKLKLLASRPQDLIDVRNLEEIQRLKNEQNKSR